MKTFQQKASWQAFEVPLFVSWCYKIWWYEDVSPFFIIPPRDILGQVGHPGGLKYNRVIVFAKVPKIHVVKVSTTLGTLAAGLRSWPWRWYQKMPIMCIQMANMLNNFPKIQGWGIKTVHARASGLHFPTPFWAWGRPRGGCTKSDLTMLLSYVLLMSYPKIIFLGLVVSEKIAKKIILFHVFYYM